MATYAPNQLHSVPLAELQPDPTQPRKYLAPLALEELATSVGQIWIIEPVVCRQDPKNVLVEIAREKQERSMATQFKKYRDQQAKTAARQTDASTTRKRTKAEALANQIGMQNKISDLDFPSFSTEDREMVTETLTSLNNTLDEALTREKKSGRKLA